MNGGEWSTRGCRREDLPGLHRIRCLCDHLTSFAVLLVCLFVIVFFRLFDLLVCWRIVTFFLPF